VSVVAQQGSGAVEEFADAMMKMVKFDIATLEKTYRG